MLMCGTRARKKRCGGEPVANKIDSICWDCWNCSPVRCTWVDKLVLPYGANVKKCWINNSRSNKQVRTSVLRVQKCPEFEPEVEINRG